VHCLCEQPAKHRALRGKPRRRERMRVWKRERDKMKNNNERNKKSHMERNVETDPERVIEGERQDRTIWQGEDRRKGKDRKNQQVSDSPNTVTPWSKYFVFFFMYWVCGMEFLCCGVFCLGVLVCMYLGL
jgi:hypothetical protein